METRAEVWIGLETASTRAVFEKAPPVSSAQLAAWESQLAGNSDGAGAQSESTRQDGNGNTIRGRADVPNRSIVIKQRGNRKRERFTVVHGIGQLLLGHDQYLRSESIMEEALFEDLNTEETFNCERLEYRANLFASARLFPN